MARPLLASIAKKRQAGKRHSSMGTSLLHSASLRCHSGHQQAGVCLQATAMRAGRIHECVAASRSSLQLRSPDQRHAG
ncbi:hypothetical protein XarbCFBP8142_07000 [Xanthomonas arboricola]|nr:hypothetical protein XarbCFBP8142_07000 [Xanthomonas arboricola]